MGQKTHPYGFRLGVIKTWTSKWYEDKHYQRWLHEDLRIKRAVKQYLYNANVASVEVERAANKAKVIKIALNLLGNITNSFNAWQFATG